MLTDGNVVVFGCAVAYNMCMHTRTYSTYYTPDCKSANTSSV